MTLPTTNASKELPAINEILASVGQAPVTTLDQTNPDVAIAYNTLLQVSREVQAEGWTFNTEYGYDFAVDTDNEVKIPNNIIQIDLAESPANINRDVVRRSGKLYDRHKHSDKFTDVTFLKCDVIWEFDWVDLPAPIQNFITARASAIVSQRIVGDTNQFNILMQNEQYTRALAMEYECNQADLSYFGKPYGSAKSVYQGFQPFHALIR